MPSTPTTKSQVQAYRFVLRRMESALVRKDPVMLHDPMRSHKRATVVGAIVGVVGLVGFLLFGVLKPAPVVPASGIVIAQPSGSVFVINQGAHQLIPVFNVVSGRLLLAAGAQQSQGGDAGSQQPGQPAPVTTVDDDELDTYSIGQMTGIPDGPTVLPKPDQPATTWAVCDRIQLDNSSPEPAGHKAPTTTVLVGLRDIGANLRPGQALLVSGDGGRTLWLVYGLASDINHPNDSAVRAQLDTSSPVLGALDVDRSAYRVVSPAVLNAIPVVAEITDPTAGLPQGQAPASLAARGLQVGQSFQVNEVGGGARYYIVVPGGAQRVSETTAQIAMYEKHSGGLRKIPVVSPQATNDLRYFTNSLRVDVSEYPGRLPAVISADIRPVMCLGWHADYTNPQKPLARTRVTTDFDLEVPADAQSPTGHMSLVQVGSGTATGKIDQFFMNPKLGGVAVRAATNEGEFASGPIYIVDPRGVRFSVPDTPTAQVLGVADGTRNGGLPPAPEAILGLLPPGGAPLSTQAVQHAVDGMPLPDVGHFLPPPAQQQQAQGGG